MYRPFLYFLVALSIVVPALGHSESDYKNAFYNGRSADIVIDAEIYPVEVQLEWQLTKKQANGLRENINTINDIHVYNIVSRSLGLPQLQHPASHAMEAELDDAVPFNFFTQTRGNILFSFEGLSTANLPASTRALGRTPVYALGQTSRPFHPLATLETLVTGVPPRRHGIVNDLSTVSTAANLNDVVRSLYGNSAKTVSGALAKNYAQALASHKDAEAYHWNAQTGAFEKLDNSVATVDVNKENIITHLVSLGFSRQISYTANKKAAIGDVNFDLTQEADNALFAEVAFVSAWSSYLAHSSVSQKHMTFHFASLAMIAEKYGRQSAQFVAAVELVDHVVFHALTGEYSFEIVYLPTYQTERVKSIKALVTPIVAKYTADNNLFPQIQLTQTGKAKQDTLCSQIREALSSATYSDVTVFCPKHLPVHMKRENLKTDDEPLLPTNTEVIAFHFILWTMLVLLAALFWAVYAIAMIPPDLSLYAASAFYKKGPAKAL